MIPKLSFRQTAAEQMVRIAASLIFRALQKAGCKLVPLSTLADDPQYGFTASATDEPVGPKLVRITDLKDGRIEWESVPYCQCPEPKKYLLKKGDILFARTGATTGKTHLVESDAKAVFASYLIRVRPSLGVQAEYLYAFFQSDSYWEQIIAEKEGSAQPNVNGGKLMTILVPAANLPLQGRVVEFLNVVRKRQDGAQIDLPLLPAPIEEQWRIVGRLEQISARIRDLKLLADQSDQLTHSLSSSIVKASFNHAHWPMTTVEELVGRANLKNGLSLKSHGLESDFQCLRLSAMRNGVIDCADSKPIAIAPNQARPYLVRSDDVFIVRGNGSKDLVGQAGMVKDHLAGTIFPDLFIRAPLNRDRILPAFFVAWWNSPLMRDKITDAAKTTSGIWKINQGHIASLPVPVPPILDQLAALRQIEGHTSRTATLQSLRSASSAELQAVLPSLLNQAFSGQL